MKLIFIDELIDSKEEDIDNSCFELGNMDEESNLHTEEESSETDGGPNPHIEDESSTES